MTTLFTKQSAFAPVFCLEKKIYNQNFVGAQFIAPKKGRDKSRPYKKSQKKQPRIAGH